MLDKTVFEQIKKFAIIGIISTAINYGVFFVLFKYLHLYYLLASACGFVTGLFFSYAFNRLWTFESVMAHKGKEFLAYAAVCVLTTAISLSALRFQVAILRINPLLANVVAIGISATLNFILLKFTVFKAKST
jgi:putative flippase GtrA